MELKLYMNTCVSCSEGDRMHRLSGFAKEKGLTLLPRRTYLLPELKKEAAEYNAQMPFIAYGDKTIDFFSIPRNYTEPLTVLEELIQ